MLLLSNINVDMSAQYYKRVDKEIVVNFSGEIKNEFMMY